MRIAPTITPTDEQTKQLNEWSRGRSTPVRLMQRAKIVLLAAAGEVNKDIAVKLDMTENTVGRWRNRFAARGLEGIEKDLPRGGRKPTARNRVERKIIKMTTQEKPSNATHWSTRTLAEELGVSQSMVHRVWRANGLKPHLVRTFKLSNDPLFEEKLIDVIGLYRNPPDNAMVFSVDEKSQVQALDRTQPSLPLVRGRCGTMTHDYKRNGTTTLFAAIDLAHGEVIAKCMSRHRHQEWIKFLEHIDELTPVEFSIHIVADNYATHKHPKVKRWLERHPRFHMHFTPTSSSWLNVIERFFRDLSEKRLRRGSFRSVEALIEAIMDYVKHHNLDPKAVVWTATVESILAKVGRARAALNNVASV